MTTILTNEQLRKASDHFLDVVTSSILYGQGTQRRAQRELDRRAEASHYESDPAEIAARQHAEDSSEGHYDYHYNNR